MILQNIRTKWRMDGLKECWDGHGAVQQRVREYI